MGFSCKQEFWLENAPDIFCSPDIIPLTNMTLEAQLNAMTRLVGIVFLVMLVTGFKYALLFLAFSLAIIIVLYFIKRKQMAEKYTVEYYTPTESSNTVEYYQAPPDLQKPGVHSFNMADAAVMKQDKEGDYGFQLGTSNNVGLTLPSSKRFCDDLYEWNPNDPKNPVLQQPGMAQSKPSIADMSWNQALVGDANPRTKIQPVVVPPIADLGYWRTNNLVTHSNVNDHTNFDAYQSGYQVSTCCGNLQDKVLVPLQNEHSYEIPVSDIPRIQGPSNIPTPELPAWHGGEALPTSTDWGGGDSGQWTNQPLDVSTRRAGSGIGGHGSGGHTNTGASRNNATSDEHFQHDVREGFEFPNLRTGPQVWPTEIGPEMPGQVNTACGYNPQQQFTAGLPTNLAAGNCQKDPIMKQYNEDLYTQTIQPNVYTRTQINEPINSNIGISFTQQYPPTTCSSDIETGEVNYLLHDPRLMEPAIVEPNMGVVDDVNYSNIYDPRHTGYGTSYRSYTDPLLGQTKFYYDDVDAIKMPSYITRSNIDFEPYADQYGPPPEDGAYGNPNHSIIRALANDSFLRNSIGHRNDLMSRQTHKMNVRAAALRAAPMRTQNSSTAGSMGCW